MKNEKTLKENVGNNSGVTRFERNQELNSTDISSVAGWDMDIVQGFDLLDEDIINELKQINPTIYHNDIDNRYWIFMFKIKDVWFEAIEIMPNRIEFIACK